MNAQQPDQQPDQLPEKQPDQRDESVAAQPVDRVAARTIDPPLQPAMVCRQCGAVNPAHAASCWVCDRQAASNPYAAPPTLEPMAGGGTASPINGRVESVFMALLLSLIGLATLIGIGIGVQDRGLLVLYLMIVGPAFLATGTRALYSVAKGQQPRGSNLIMVFIWSAVFTAAILCLLMVAAVVALFVVCFNMLNGPH